MCDKMDDLREVGMIYLAMWFARDEQELMSSTELLMFGSIRFGIGGET